MAVSIKDRESNPFQLVIVVSNLLSKGLNTSFKLRVNNEKNIKFESNQSNIDFEIIDSENIIFNN